ncbi:MAG TPA: PilZ domain-containing protein, partial [Thermodesulfobacteriota bacterium]|nr:PilZ domain-containing protein [Thermodesulfobacteriota bacterium]
FRYAIALQPTYAEAHCLIADIFFLFGAYPLAGTEYQCAVMHEPGLSAAHAGLGDVHARLGRYEDSVTSYQNALNAEERVCEEGNRLAVRKEYEKAVDAYQVFLARESGRSARELEQAGADHVSDKEERKFGRLPLVFPTELRIDGAPACWAPTVNISLEGLLVGTIDELVVGSEVEIIAAQSQESKKTMFHGTIVRKNPKEKGRRRNTFAVEFVNKDEAFEIWEQFLPSITSSWGSS